MNVLAAILVIENYARFLFRTPFLDDPTRQERDARRNKVVKKKIAGTGPSSLTLRSNEMNKEVRHLSEDRHERPRPSMTQPAPNHRARIVVEKWVPPGRLIDRQIHPAARLQDTAVFGKGGARIVGVMNHAVGDHRIGGPVRKREMQVVGHDSGSAIAFHCKTDRYAAAVET